MWFVVYEVLSGSDSSMNTSLFPCQCHSNNAPYISFISDRYNIVLPTDSFVQ